MIQCYVMVSRNKRLLISVIMLSYYSYIYELYVSYYNYIYELFKMHVIIHLCADSMLQ